MSDYYGPILYDKCHTKMMDVLIQVVTDLRNNKLKEDSLKFYKHNGIFSYMHEPIDELKYEIFKNLFNDIFEIRDMIAVGCVMPNHSFICNWAQSVRGKCDENYCLCCPIENIQIFSCPVQIYDKQIKHIRLSEIKNLSNEQYTLVINCLKQMRDAQFKEGISLESNKNGNF